MKIGLLPKCVVNRWSECTMCLIRVLPSTPFIIQIEAGQERLEMLLNVAPSCVSHSDTPVFKAPQVGKISYSASGEEISSAPRLSSCSTCYSRRHDIGPDSLEWTGSLIWHACDAIWPWVCYTHTTCIYGELYLRIPNRRQFAATVKQEHSCLYLISTPTTKST